MDRTGKASMGQGGDLAMTRGFPPVAADPFGVARSAWRVAEIALAHGAAIADDQGSRWQAGLTQAATVLRVARTSGRHATPADWAGHWRDYLRDSAERAVLLADILRDRSDAVLAAEGEDAPPALGHPHEPVMDAGALPRPGNAHLVRLVPAKAPDPAARPVLLIGARAGQGAGLDAAVAVALAAGLPVYAVVFARVPVPGQTVADIIDACAAFAAEVARRHPDAPPPLVAGQGPGGWAPLVLAAAHPGCAGAVLLDGVPVAPGRTALALAGGALPALLSDLGGGLFDGATPALAAALADPAGALVRPNATLFAEADRTGPRAVEAARRAGGLPLLTADEARWTAAALPPGDLLARNAAALAPGRPLDLRAVAVPVVLMARPDDPAAAPAEALGWLRQSYADAAAIRAAGQRIVLLCDPAAGPGLLMAGTIAGAPALRAIEALPPGLYALCVDKVEGWGAARRAELSLAPCDLDDLAGGAGHPADARTFAAAARATRMQADSYEALARPLLCAAIAPPLAEASRALHPVRLWAAALSSRNPALGPVAAAAARVRDTRQPAAPDNPFTWMERMGVDLTCQWLDLTRAVQSAAVETGFHAVWGNPWMRAFAPPAAAAAPRPAPDAAPPRRARRKPAQPTETAAE
ncbi:DUF3141 domain-containing protein [Rhodovulum euryhalinum]|uniref:Uncharacterized protein DUF3141 n=1 Tax=Rhodovulum euryhalinum TaxID=35805 RepID=A0A4R2KIV5_9RHOB|nr:DUF3141 domain-containing protein [Rhodovulum euryhalinum]TCO72337.1 uncharacterized protein DUF3141 [Rhodovulum euryhalinum]